MSDILELCVCVSLFIGRQGLTPSHPKGENRVKVAAAKMSLSLHDMKHYD